MLANTAEQKTLYEIFMGKRPNVSNLKPFGSHVFVRISGVKRKYKVNPKAEMDILVGYTDTGYRVLVNDVVKENAYVRLAAESTSKLETVDGYHFNGNQSETEDEPDP